MKHYGLIGRPLGHSASARYFTAKFEREAIDAEYSLYELPDIGAVDAMLPADIEGFNVTIPYKREIIPLLDEVSPEAHAVGAVNCVKVTTEGLVGYNTMSWASAGRWRGLSCREQRPSFLAREVHRRRCSMFCVRAEPRCRSYLAHEVWPI